MDPQTPSQMPPSAPPPNWPAPVGATAVDPKVRNLAIGMFICAALVLIATFTSGWATAERGPASIGAGLTGIEGCFRGHCESASWSKSKAPGDFTFIGYLGLLGGLASTGVGIALGVFGITGKRNPIPDQVANGVFGVTAFAFTFFTIRLMTESNAKQMSIGYSAFLGIAGIIGLGVVANMLKKARTGA